MSDRAPDYCHALGCPREATRTTSAIIDLTERGGALVQTLPLCDEHASRADAALASLGRWDQPADQALITAAPDLLKACKALVSAWNAPTGYGVSRQMDDAEALALAAIAKAEGRQP